MTRNGLRIAIYEDAGDFLHQAQETLERKEIENHLILGICQRMRDNPEMVNTQPFLATIEAHREIVLGVMMTPPHPLLLTLTGKMETSAYPLLVKELQKGDWPVTEINGPAALSSEFADLWASETGTHKQIGREQRLYAITRVGFPQGVSGELRKATCDDLPVVVSWGEAFSTELNLAMSMDRSQFSRVTRNQIADGSIYLWDDMGPVSMAMKNRPSRNGVAVSYVYTPPSKRRHGYASACVAALSQALLAAGYKFCTLFTDFQNPTTNHIYQKVGYQHVADFTSYTFS